MREEGNGSPPYTSTSKRKGAAFLGSEIGQNSLCDAQSAEEVDVEDVVNEIITIMFC